MDYPPDTLSIATVTFVDGEVKTYPVGASPKIATYLSRQVSETGVLVLFTVSTSVSIPIAQVRDYVLEAYEKEPPNVE